MPAIGGAPGSAVASPTTPDESTIRGSIRFGTRSVSSVSSDQADASLASSPVTAALVASAMWRARAGGERPHDRVVDGADAEVALTRRVGLVEQPLELRGRLVGRQSEALAAQLEAAADRAQVLPAEAGPHRLARGSVPHDRRAALVGDADGVDRAGGVERGTGRVDGRSRHAGRIAPDHAG